MWVHDINEKEGNEIWLDIWNCPFSFSGKREGNSAPSSYQNCNCVRFLGVQSPYARLKDGVATWHHRVGKRREKDKEKEQWQLRLRAVGWFGKKCLDIPFQLRKTKTLFSLQLFLFKNSNLFLFFLQFTFHFYPKNCNFNNSEGI